MLVSRTQAHVHLNFDYRQLRLKDGVEILGVTYDNKMTFNNTYEERHLETSIAANNYLAFNVRGRENLYKTQIRSLLEHTPHVGEGGTAACHPSLQERARRLTEDDELRSSGGTLLPSL